MFAHYFPRLAARLQRVPAEPAGLGALLLLAVGLLSASWRKWADPLIDFGRELYLPWRISEGGVIYRDFDANYGPLSHYFNAGLFKLFGPGYSVIFAANLLIWAGSTVLLYAVLRRAWGRWAAWVGTATFILVFSFNQFVGIANYNFASPYSHEATHGMFLVLLTLWLWPHTLRAPSRARAMALGFIVGLGLLLKLEIVFALALITATGAGLAWRQLPAREWRGLVAWAAGAALVPPVVASLVLFGTGRFDLGAAFVWANSAWTGVFLYPGIGNLPVQSQLMGTDQIGGNTARILGAALLVLGGGAALGAALRIALRADAIVQRLIFIGAGLVLLFSPAHLNWLEAGRVFPACLAALAVALWFERRDTTIAPEVRALRWLLLVAAGAFLARMALNPRLYHYGFFQAALAGVLSSIVLLHHLPRWLRLEGRAAQLYLAAAVFWLGCGFAWLQRTNLALYEAKTLAVGEGRDRFYTFEARVDASGHLLEQARRALIEAKAPGPVLVLPEGVMLNYLLRLETPSHVYAFLPYWLNWQESILRDLNARPPAYIVKISRDLREFGVARFGESRPHGSALLEWIERRGYAAAGSLGGDPFDPKQRGIVVLRRSDVVPPPTPPKP